MGSGRALIGTSGWSYRHWKERFYPSDVPQRKWLEYFAEHLPTVELNNTFYHQPKNSTFDGWHERTPEGFVFAVKMSRYITHRRLLVDVEEALQTFFSGALRLKEKLGPILVQLPPSLHRDDERLGAFLELLRSKKAWSDLRCTVEFRHNSWLVEEVYELLKQANCALCWQDLESGGVSDLTTADFLYLRRHGPGGRYASCYSDEALSHDARLVAEHLRQGRDAYVYFNNDAEAFAVQNARTLTALVKEEVSASGSG